MSDTGAESEENELKLDAVLVDYLRRCDAGEQLDRASFLQQHPELAEQLEELLVAADAIELMAGPTVKEESLPPNAQPLRKTLAEEQLALEKEQERRLLEQFKNNQSQYSQVTPSTSGNDLTLPLGNMGVSQTFEPNLTLPLSGNIDSNRDLSHGAALNSSLPRVDSTQPTLPCRFGDYILDKLLGRGGMGVVYRAHQLHLDRRVAVKMIRSGALASDEEVQRFYAEARSAAKLDHPNIVTVYQCGECDGHHFFSMDYVPGTDLSRRVQEGAMENRLAAKYVLDAARAIQYAHERGVLHRDLKPANILIDAEDEVHITDFGLAKVMGKDSGLTRSGAALGTPSYMSPEQAGGRTDEHAETTDVYSLGAILFALVTGRPPFQGNSVVQTMMQVIHRPAPSARQIRPEVDRNLDTIITKCLQKQPNRRYQSAAELAEELDNYLHGRPIKARPLNGLEKAWHWSMGIPLIGALTGYKVLDPSPAHRWAQRAIIACMVMIPLILLLEGTVLKWWNNRLPSTVHVAAGDADGLYYSIASEIGKRFGASTGCEVKLQTTEGSMENARLLLTEQSELALLQSSSVRSDRISVVAPLYHETVHILVHKDFGATKLSELKNGRIWLGAEESGSHEAAEIILELSGIEPNQYAVADSAWTTLEKGEGVDAAFVVIKAGHPRISRLLESGLFRLMSIENTTQIALDEPTFRPMEVESSTYTGLPAEGIKTLATTAYLACRRDAPSSLVNAALSSLYVDGEPIPELMTMERAKHWRGLALHPASQRFFETIAEPQRGSERP